MRASEIHILGVPLGLGAGRLGAEAGDRAVRTAQLREELKALGYDVSDVDSVSVPVPSDGPGDPSAKYAREIASVCGDIADWIGDRHRDRHFPLIIGGDHSIGAGTVTGTSRFLRERGEKLGVIWIDAHADMNTPSSSPSGNVHGMPLAALLGEGVPQLVDLAGYSPKIDPANTVIVGAREIDADEQEVVARTGVRVITIREIDERGMFHVMAEAIERALEGTAGLHLSFDMDALDPSIAPGVGTPVPGGLTYREAHLACEMIADTDALLSMDVVEVNPMLDAHGMTARMAVGLISSALGKRILRRRAGLRA